MLPRVKIQTFWIILLIFSILWTVATLGPFLYSIIAPTKDLSAIVRAMEGRGSAPSGTESLVQRIFDQGGTLKRAVHVGHYAGASAILQNGRSHTSSEVSDTYVAWFAKINHPLALVVRRYSQDGEVQRYEVGSGDSTLPIIRAYILPLLALAVSLFLVSKRKSPMLVEPPGQTTPAMLK
jgi:hypothetical protein